MSLYKSVAKKTTPVLWSSLHTPLAMLTPEEEHRQNAAIIGAGATMLQSHEASQAVQVQQISTNPVRQGLLQTSRRILLWEATFAVTQTDTPVLPGDMRIVLKQAVASGILSEILSSKLMSAFTHIHNWSQMADPVVTLTRIPDNNCILGFHSMHIARPGIFEVQLKTMLDTAPKLWGITNVVSAEQSIQHFFNIMGCVSNNGSTLRTYDTTGGILPCKYITQMRLVQFDKVYFASKHKPIIFLMRLAHTIPVMKPTTTIAKEQTQLGSCARIANEAVAKTRLAVAAANAARQGDINFQQFRQGFGSAVPPSEVVSPDPKPPASLHTVAASIFSTPDHSPYTAPLELVRVKRRHLGVQRSVDPQRYNTADTSRRRLAMTPDQHETSPLHSLHGIISNRAIFDSSYQTNFVHAPLGLHDTAAQQRIHASLVRDISASRPTSAFSAYTSAYVHPHARVCKCIRIHIHRHTYIHVYTYTLAPIRTYMHTHIHTHAYAHLCTDRKS